MLWIPRMWVGQVIHTLWNRKCEPNPDLNLPPLDEQTSTMKCTIDETPAGVEVHISRGRPVKSLSVNVSWLKLVFKQFDTQRFISKTGYSVDRPLSIVERKATPSTLSDPSAEHRRLGLDDIKSKAVVLKREFSDVSTLDS